MGLGSIVGTGVFVSIGIATEIAGSSVVLAIVLAAMVAAFNGLSSAQLAANHPVSGGSYEYGYRWLNPTLGFTAGWMFLCAKSASAAAASLGFATYCLNLFGIQISTWIVPLAIVAAASLTLLVLGGLQRSNRTNAVIVSITLLSLAFFIVVGLVYIFQSSDQAVTTTDNGASWPSFFEASALMFVAFTGYGRIATLGEEVVDPRRTIPAAIIYTLIIAATLYIGVAIVCVGMATGPQRSTLQSVAEQFNTPLVAAIVSIGAITAMLGVLLNLILGLSRVVLAMGRRGDFPRGFAHLSSHGNTPTLAILAVGATICFIALIGDLKTTWSFSAFTVLVYYALTNLAAIRLTQSERLYPRFISYLGLTSCLSLAFWVQPRVWITGLVLIAIGLFVQQLMHRIYKESNQAQ